MLAKQEIEIQAVAMLDLPQIQSIFNHYVVTSAVTFQVNPVGPDYFVKKFEDTQSLGLPFLVAKKHDTDTVVGYAYASGFRNFMQAYKHTVEITIFLHPDFKSRGVGSRLIAALLDALRAVGAGSNPARPDKLKEAIACIADDNAESEEAGRGGLRKWYEERGFREVGRMPGVGWKFDRWIGVIFLQLGLRSAAEMRDTDTGGGCK